MQHNLEELAEHLREFDEMLGTPHFLPRNGPIWGRRIYLFEESASALVAANEEIKALEVEVKALRVEVKDLEDERDDLSGKVGDLEEEISDLKAERDDLAERAAA